MKKSIATLAVLFLFAACTSEGEADDAAAPEPSPSRSAASPTPLPDDSVTATPDQLPPILVTKPGMSEQISSPLTVEGTADVFEATVQMRLMDAAGNRLARAFTTATCGTGCRGDFRHELTFEVDQEQHGVLEVWWDSPEDGSRRDVVRIAVTLVP